MLDATTITDSNFDIASRRRANFVFLNAPFLVEFHIFLDLKKPRKKRKNLVFFRKYEI